MKRWNNENETRVFDHSQILEEFLDCAQEHCHNHKSMEILSYQSNDNDFVQTKDESTRFYKKCGQVISIKFRFYLRAYECFFNLSNHTGVEIVKINTSSDSIMDKLYFSKDKQKVKASFLKAINRIVEMRNKKFFNEKKESEDWQE